MFCPNCGKEITENAKFCRFCGMSFLQSSFPPKKPKKDRDFKKIKLNLKKASIYSLISFILCFVISASLMSYYILVPQAAFEDVPETPPKQKTVSEPVYDVDYMSKAPSDLYGSYSAGSDEEVSALVKDISVVESAINDALTEVLEENPDVTIENRYEYISAAASAARTLRSEDVISNYWSDNDCVTIELLSGIKYVYVPEIEEYDAGTSGVLKVATYQPYVSDYKSNLSSYMTYPDDAAKNITTTFEMYAFDGDKDDYNDSEVDLNSLTETGGYNVLLWHGHGGFSGSVGSFMGTGIEINEQFLQEYYSLFKDNSFVASSSGRVCVTAEFFENHIAPNAYDNTIVYLGTCSSGASNTLAKSFLDKGAEAVYANSGTIATKYNLSMIKSVVEGLCTTNSTGGYLNVTEALNYAMTENGDYDKSSSNRTKVKLFTENDKFSLDWYNEHVIADREVVLLLDNSGSMNGTPMTETKEAAQMFVKTVLDAKATVSVVSYSYNAHIKSGFSYNQNTLINAINSMYPDSTTNIYDGLLTAEELLKDSKAEKKIIILMSDGVPNEGLVGDRLIEYAESIRNEGIYIYSLGFFHNISGQEKTAAQTLMAAIADQGSYHDVADADDIEFVFDDIASEISGERRIYIKIACPVDVEIKYGGETLSKDNTRTSFGTISFEEIEGKDETIKTVRLKEGFDYDINIEGTDSGSMNYTIGFMNENSEYTDFREFKDIKITEDTEIQAKAVYSKTTTLFVDEDGDGKTDLVYRASKNGDAEKTEIVSDWRLVVSIISFGLGVITLIAFIILRKFYKKIKI